ncbi:TonB-dependent receptor [Sphingomonas panacisoli]|uniref:TonB-dependent receptor n=1 Tax=Sphingomonas panacisoli TaxID=1813879 RepID=A0A5B8LH89_9SPHN|nr:TonB-dependent receptor [Sphingomonas panacisoli]QDZ07145.1 TonB-dependent receptor [Sphingomonas panacisoli]
MTGFRNNRRNGLALHVSALALAGALATVASPALAQDAPAPAPADQATDDTGPDIVVSGFRAALASATAKKKNSEQVVESVSAEDIGKLPDNGIGESIARLPGISSQRNAGRANIISIRGFGPDFSTTTLNGRQQTTTNDSRAVEFDQYPSEILAGVDVYKTAAADKTSGGLVGTIDLRTMRPLEVGKRIIAVGVRGTYVDQKLDPNSSDKGFRAFATYVDTFADGNAGIALSAAYTDEPYQTRDFNAWGFGGYPGGAQGMNGIKTWVETDKLKRFGINGTFQARAGNNVTITMDAFYSRFTDKIDQRGFEMPFNCGGGCGHDAISNVTASNGLVTSATIAGTPIIENYANDRKADQYSLAGNLAWKNDGWSAMIDASWSRTDRTDDSLQTTAGLGRALPAATAVVSYTATPKGPQFTSNYNGASSALVLTDVEGWSGSPVQAGYDNFRRTSDDLFEARAEIEREIGGFVKSIKAGADFTKRTKTLSAQEGYLSPPGGANTAAIPSNLRLEPVTLDRGLGPLVSFDPRALVPAGVLVYTANTFGASKGYNIGEDVWTPYAMATLDADLGSSKLTGNIGVQGVYTRVTSSGQAFPTVKDDYWMVLPSLNLNLRTASDFVIRFAASKEMMRPRLPDLNNVISYGIDRTRSPIVFSGSGGNPTLRPYRATAFDLNFEKYFGSKGYLAIQLFYKNIDNYIANGFTANFDYSGFPPVPGNPQPATPIGILFANVNTKGGHMDGVEVAGTLPFDVFSNALSGFGLTGGAGYTETKVKDFNGNPSVIPGYSKWVASATLFFEKYGFSLRGSMRYRSSYLGDFSLYSGGLDRQTVLGETIYDAQIGYDFSSGSLKGLSLYVSGQNLTDTRSATLGIVTQPLSYLKYQSYGRRIVAGATFKF